MVLALLALCAYFSYATLAEQSAEGADAGRAVAEEVVRRAGPGARVLVVIRDISDDAEFAEALKGRLTASGGTVVATVRGEPSDARRTLREMAKSGEKVDAIAAPTMVGRSWRVLHDTGKKFPGLGDVPVVMPESYRWPNFLKASNLLNIANQIAVIAIIAIGMTLVILTGGIDLSVGSLMALSAVAATLLIREYGGARSATPAGMVLCCLAAIALCGAVGWLNGLLVTHGELPPFIATLGMMLMARGTASRLSNSQSVYEVPASFTWLGLGADLGRIPNAVVLMLLLYAVAQVVMTRMTLGRYVYAVGGNAEAARLSGVPVRRVVVLVYVVSGALAGLGGVVMASQLQSGSPTYGLMYEMYVIAAVVVGGTSISGGEGRVLGTLVGALLIAVINNGMNLMGIPSETQLIVLGAVIIGAVLFDRLQKRGWGRRT
jgi:ribose transport system permease protein